MSQVPIRVLVVDDSAFARKVIREVLSRDSEIEVVGYARDGLDALEKITELKPDVITLDLVMPDLDGVGVLKALQEMKLSAKVVVVSVSRSDADLAIEALELGAVDLVTKSTPLPTDRLYELSNELILKVKAASIAKFKIDLSVSQQKDRQVRLIPRAGQPTAQLIVMGTSTGGPQALTELFKTLPKEIPVPIAVALHIPAGYTAPLAERISRTSGVRMVEAYDGLKLKAGEAVLAPGGMHLKISSEKGELIARVSEHPLETLYHPSVDILFQSAAESVGEGAVGVILTGMGNDGTLGARAIKAAGGQVLAESSSSCVVYGMPRSVIEAGLSDFESPLEDLSSQILSCLYSPSKA